MRRPIPKTNPGQTKLTHEEIIAVCLHERAKSILQRGKHMNVADAQRGARSAIEACRKEGPQTSIRVGFDIMGLELRCTLDYGAAVLDFRGLYKNPGA